MSIPPFTFTEFAVLAMLRTDTEITGQSIKQRLQALESHTYFGYGDVLAIMDRLGRYVTYREIRQNPEGHILDLAYRLTEAGHEARAATITFIQSITV